jgi:MFS superfamily sulfate permease-like transporter
LVVLLGTAFNEILIATGSPLALGETHLVKMHVPTSVTDFFGQFTLPDIHGFADKHVWITGIVIAAVASIETLLCIEATDKLDPLKRYTSGNVELRAQGIGNLLSGLVGGLPITSVIVRSSANINAGARSKLSTIFHGTLLLVCAASIPMLLNHIPKASLAAILLFTGYRLCRPSVFKHMWKEGGATQFVPFLVTVIAVVALDLLKGVGIGLIISILFMLRQNIRIPFYYQRSSYSNGDLIKLTLAQEVSFLNKASIKQTLENLPANSVVIIDASLTEYIDFDVLDLIRDFHDSKAPTKNIKLSLIGFKNTYKVPSSISEREVLSGLVDADETPKRSSGNYKKLLRQLVNDN